MLSVIVHNNYTVQTYIFVNRKNNNNDIIN